MSFEQSSVDVADELSQAPSDLTFYVENKAALYKRLDGYQPINANDDTAYFLRMFFKFLPADGKSNLSCDVVGCESDDILRELVRSLETGLLNPIKAVGGKTPAAIFPSPRLGVEDSIETLYSMDHQSCTRNDQSGLRIKCLARDGQRCVVSGCYNNELVDPPRGEPYAPLEAAHILPFSLGAFGNEDERRGNSGIWTNIYRCFPSLRSRLNFTSERINGVQNMLILSAPLHTEFGQFHFCLEASNVENEYHVKTFRRFSTMYNFCLPADRIVRFVSHDPAYPLPHPLLLQTHAAVANVLNATGRAEEIERVLRDYGRDGDSSHFLAPDGSTDVNKVLSTTRLALLKRPDPGRQSRPRSQFKTQPRRPEPKHMKQHSFEASETTKVDEISKENQPFR